MILRLHILASCLLIFGCLVANAEEREKDLSNRTALILSGWQEWAQKHNVSVGSIAISYRGKLMAVDGVGGRSHRAAPIASVSKQITGVCVALLAEQEGFSLNDKINAHLPDIDIDVTLASLLTHTSGYRANITQWHPSDFPGVDGEYLEWVSQTEIENSVGETKKYKPGEFFYNNSNYALLGWLISQKTGKSYEEACGDLVLEPAGISQPSLNPEWRIMSSWGGWMLSVEDMLKFSDTYFSADGVLKHSPDNFPHHSFGNGLSYGMGYVFLNGRKGGFNFFHDGKWHIDFGGKEHRFGAYLVRWDNGWAVATTHSISALGNEHLELDTMLVTATHKELD